MDNFNEIVKKLDQIKDINNLGEIITFEQKNTIIQIINSEHITQLDKYLIYKKIRNILNIVIDAMKYKLEKSKSKLFNEIRNYHVSGNNNVEELKDEYLRNIKLAKDLGMNEWTKLKREYNNLRIMSWNVRYWTDVNNKPSIQNIAEVIREIDPDIVCLQEATFGMSKHYPDAPVDIREYLPEYTLSTFCNIIPSWYETIYGNAILISNKLVDVYKKVHTHLSDDLCDNSMPLCSFNQYSKTYDYPRPERKLYGALATEINTIKKTETRCYNKISLVSFDIFNTHLDANNSRIRKLQFDEVYEQATRDAIILGDFNIVDTSIYLDEPQKTEAMQKEWEYLKRIHSFSDNNNNNEYQKLLEEYSGLSDPFKRNKKSFDLTYSRITKLFSNSPSSFDDFQKIESNVLMQNMVQEIFTFLEYQTYKNNNNTIIKETIRPNISVWSNTVVDHIFFLNRQLIPLSNMYIHFNEYSDHLPIIIDISDKEHHMMISNYNEIITKNENTQNNDSSEYKCKIIPFDDFYGRYRDRLVYNGQPLAAFDWYDIPSGNVNSKYSFSDPMKTGNYSLKFGHNGVYITASKEDALIYGMTTFQNNTLYNDTSLNDHQRKGLRCSWLEFSWMLNNNNNNTIICDFPRDWNYYDGMSDSIALEYDKLFDIIAHNRGPTHHGKITNKNFDKITGKHHVAVLVDVCICVTDNNSNSLPSECIDKSMEKYYDEGISETNIPKKFFYGLMNAIWYINRRSNNGIYWNLINPEKIRSVIYMDSGYPFPTWKISMSLYYKNTKTNMIGGNNRKYYLGAKNDYIKIRNNIS